MSCLSLGQKLDGDTTDDLQRRDRDPSNSGFVPEHRESRDEGGVS